MNYRLLAKIILGVAAVILIIAIIINIASSPSQEPVVETDTANTETVLEQTSKSKVRFTLEGPIVAREDHKQIRITVDKDSRIIELISGYNNQVVEKKSYKNDTNAYRSFIAGLDNEGFLNSKEGTADSPLGVCPEGKRRIVEYFLDGSIETSLFSGSCSKKIGTLAGDISDIEDLFEDQIPNFRDLTRDFDL